VTRFELALNIIYYMFVETNRHVIGDQIVRIGFIHMQHITANIIAIPDGELVSESQFDRQCSPFIPSVN